MELVILMNLKPSLKSIIIPLIAIMLSLSLGQISFGQSVDHSRLETAARRSQNAAKTIKVITGFPEDETISIDLLNRAKAIGVFPDVKKMSLLFQQAMGGRGVICGRQPGGWSLPAYYAFGSTEMNSKIASFKSFDVVVLFMNGDTVNWFQKGALHLKGVKAGVGGPVGKISPEALNQILRANVIIYALIDGKLKGMAVEGDFLNDAIINPDNNINKAIYGLKGREVLEGKAPKVSPTAPGVTAYRDILNEHFSVSR